MSSNTHYHPPAPTHLRSFLGWVGIPPFLCVCLFWFLAGGRPGKFIYFLHLSLIVTEHHMGFPGGSAGKESSCSAGDLGLIPGLGRSPGEGNGYWLQYSGLENPMDRGAWQATIHGVTKSWTWMSNFHFIHFKYFPVLFAVYLLTRALVYEVL